ncbi:MAG: polyphosphate:AMP phosphotransferase [Cyanophyceae cyanobacterium]
MLDRVDLEASLDKETYRERIESLTLELRSLQEECREAKIPVIILLEGWATAGKGKIVQRMLKHMDPRGFTVHSIMSPTSQERHYPWLWRFWQLLPGLGQTGIFYHSWYSRLVEGRLFQRISEREFQSMMQEVNDFERLLTDDGVVMAKFFIHLGRKELKKRLNGREADPFEAWRVRPEDWQQAKYYEEYQDIASTTLAKTNTANAPWTIVAGNDKRWSRIRVLKTMFDVVSTALAGVNHPAVPRPHFGDIAHTGDSENIGLVPFKRDGGQASQADAQDFDPLAQVDLTVALERDRYKTLLNQYQLRLRHLQKDLHDRNRAVLVLFEGWDAAGKGGAIKRLTDSLDPRSYIFFLFDADTVEEKQHHYLWRFWRCLPTQGAFTVFDRTWYGRVLVERVEGFAEKAEWQRAYGEINALEAQLRRSQMTVVKFWLHIDPDEQLRRFQERLTNPFKRHKITDEDWRNRERWDDYYQAVSQMLHHTHTDAAPWSVIAANNKLYARVQVIKTVIEAIDADLVWQS